MDWVGSMKARRLKQLKRVLRIDDRRVVKEVIVEQPGERRLRGNSRVRWIDDGERDLTALRIRRWSQWTLYQTYCTYWPTMVYLTVTCNAWGKCIKGVLMLQVFRIQKYASRAYFGYKVQRLMPSSFQITRHFDFLFYLYFSGSYIF